MTTNTLTPQELIQKASQALGRGDKRAARTWAQLAVARAPQNEEPWLILAAVSSPQASLEYLKQALLVNPGSERAMRGLRWAQTRLAEQRPKPKTAIYPLAATQPTRLPPKPQTPPRKPPLRLASALVTFLLLACVAFVWVIWPGNAASALALIRSENTSSVGGPAWSLADIAKPTYTPSATATLLPTATPTLTPTSTPTSAPTPTALPTDGPVVGPVTGAQPSPASDGKYILVSISEQHLYAYQDGELVYSVIASTGMNHSTRAGVFHVLDKIPNAYGATWNIWMPNWLGIYYSGSLENGIHALPILSNGARLWAGYLGTPISFGCVVLGVDDAQWIYDWADVGTTVEIRY